MSASVWLRDLTRECVEANPGPVCCRHEDCRCTYSKAELDAGVGLTVAAAAAAAPLRCQCGHPVDEHTDPQPQVAAAAGAAAAAPSPVFLAAIKEAVRRVLAESQPRRERVSTSEMNQCKFVSLFQGMAGVSLNPIRWPRNYTAHLQGKPVAEPIVQPPPFGWEAGKDEDAQHEQYLAYAKQVIPLPDGLELIRAPPGLLRVLRSAGHRVLPFDISGTTDLCIIRKAAHLTPSLCLHVAIELKPTWQRKEGGAADEYERRVMQGKDVFEACAQLVAADILSPITRPVVLLTNLNDEWRFLWLREKRTIVQVKAPTRGEALLLLRRLLTVDAADAYLYAPPGLAAAAAAAEAHLADDAFFDNPTKRRKLSPARGSGPDSDSSDDDDEEEEEEDDDPAYSAAMRQRMLVRILRNTPFMHELITPPMHTLTHPHMSQAARQSMHM